MIEHSRKMKESAPKDPSEEETSDGTKSSSSPEQKKAATPAEGREEVCSHMHSIGDGS